MTARFLPTLVALFVVAAPAAAVAQTAPYNPTVSTQTETSPYTPTTPTDSEETPPAQAPDKAEVDAGEAAPAPAAPAAVQPVATGTAPSTLAYTGSEAWLFGLVGMLALAGGVALMRTSRRA